MNRFVLLLFAGLLSLPFSFVGAEELERGKHFFYTPEEAAANMTAPDGFHVIPFAGEPDVRQPNAFCIDDRGRLWVGENYTYTKYGWSPDKRDRILIFEDTDGDGRFDTRKVFTEDITYVSGLEVGYGGVWVGSVPNLLFIPDADGDDVPDGKARIVRDGWGGQDQHETLNTFTWGPDGWLYGCHGVFTHSKVGKPGEPDSARTPLNGGVWRYHPLHDQFEVFAWGTSNPWGIDFDDNGQLLMTACVIPHLWHVIQGARYHRQAGTHFNPYVFDDIKTIALHTHKDFKGRPGGHAHGGALLYLGESYPDEYRGKLFMCSIHHHMMYVDQLKQHRSGFQGEHHSDFIIANDKWFLGFNLQLGPDGAIYVIDWYDSKECHGETPEGKDTGRIYKITYGDSKAESINMKAHSTDRLAEQQLSRNEWKVRHARRLLAERAAAGQDVASAVKKLQAMVASKETTTPQKLRALWALHGMEAVDDALLLGLLDSSDPYLRSWAIQLDLEDKQTTAEQLARYEAMAADDPSPVVRLYLASALQRLPLEQRWTLAANLIAHEEDADDHNLPLVYWYGIEPLVELDRAQALKLAAGCKISKVRQFIARRAAGIK
ncbi:PVC-type heme-binding CxxCH protein [Lignipirellula cremea]|uniref:DUF7133 domain-containing protein n=1 Tax=Lignipirellula cremea TaxID=2528010 RepID=A0A518DWA9_9BACT|nr:PVC-type heme-binding CxxCH protein [Lignipirellula cremea]QDU96117.1 hypothetical protein Pla8534_39360 [Lignipirellula cremea]